MDCRTCNLKYLLGLQMFEEGLRCPLCHAVANPFGDHQVDCGGNRERILRHNSFGYAVFSVSCLGAPKGSPLSSPRHPEPACWHLPPLLEKGLPSRFDVTVISTWQQSTIRGAAKKSGRHPLVCQGEKVCFPWCCLTHHLYTKIAISLWRGNASTWIHRCPQLTPSFDLLVCVVCFVLFSSITLSYGKAVLMCSFLFLCS